MLPLLARWIAVRADSVLDGLPIIDSGWDVCV